MTAVPLVPTIATGGDSPPGSEYERLADRFSRIYAETGSIAATLELLDAERAGDTSSTAIDLQLPNHVLDVAASLYYVKPARRLLRPGSHRDICAARWIASWLLRKHGWTTLKIGRFLSVDHSTVIHGLRRVAADATLRRMVCLAAELLASRSARVAPP
jgi:chromosomal replication initiation ATPase DnaA